MRLFFKKEEVKALMQHLHDHTQYVCVDCKAVTLTPEKEVLYTASDRCDKCK